MHHRCLVTLIIGVVAISKAIADAPAGGTNAPPAFAPAKYGATLISSPSGTNSPDFSKIGATRIAEGKTNSPTLPPGFVLDTPEMPAKVLSRLRLQILKNLSIGFIFSGYEQLNGEYLFKIYLNGIPLSEQPGLKKAGEDLGFDGYVIGAFHLNIVDEEAPATHIIAPIDESTLDLDNPTTGQKVTLTFRQEGYSSDIGFVLLIPSEEKKIIKAQCGQTFTVPFTNTKYELIDAKDTGAVICNMVTHDHMFVPALGASEYVAPANEQDGLGTVVDYDEVAKREAGNAVSVHNALGQVYSWTYSQNGQSYQWNPIGPFTVGIDYEWGTHGLPKDSKQAMIWYLRAANLGDPQGQDTLGDVFQNGGFSHENPQTGYLVCDNSVV